MNLALPAGFKHWSYSSLNLFLKNRLQFKKNYLMNIWDITTSPSALVGSAVHQVLEHYYNGKTIAEATEFGLIYINNTPDHKVKWGKTGNREDVIKKFTKALDNYFSEEPEFHKVIAAEKTMVQFISIGDAEVPMKCKTDLLFRNKYGKLEAADFKVVSSFASSEEDQDDTNPEYILQAIINALVIEKEYGEPLTKFTFLCIKPSANKNGDPQVQPYSIILSEHKQYFTIVRNIIADCTKEICKPDCLFLPNFGDMYTGKESFVDYAKQVITVDLPTVERRTKIEKPVERKYVESSIDRVENRDLTQEERIKAKLVEFGISVEMKDTIVGSNVILYTLKPSRGIKMSQFDNYAKDIQLALKATSIRIQAPIVGTDLVGIEIPNTKRSVIKFDESMLTIGSTLIPIGVDVYGNTFSKDLTDMPHLLVAGATGSGKSVMINVIIKSLLKQNMPTQLQMILIDPKRVELSQYKNEPHLQCPIIFDYDKAVIAMEWLVRHMNERFDLLEKANCTNITEYNKNNIDKLAKIAVVIDEFADLALADESGKFNKALIKLAQKARAAGIHLILGTQRPSVDVISGLLKANIPTRIAFTTSSRIDSQVILDEPGAEELGGKGDMLISDPSIRGLKRLQGFFI